MNINVQREYIPSIQMACILISITGFGLNNNNNNNNHYRNYTLKLYYQPWLPCLNSTFNLKRGNKVQRNRMHALLHPHCVLLKGLLMLV